MVFGQTQTGMSLSTHRWSSTKVVDEDPQIMGSETQRSHHKKAHKRTVSARCLLEIAFLPESVLKLGSSTSSN